ncbi:aminoglycoside phosphotransferase family protein [Actinoallomurus bryophytorum]|uniref:Aminoglycoside phosphotransferase (APT) family kinase protein n=1 Tax=Actinoallomurus bryophytorum TaxID=1490222 RepID=A0A543CGB2_9ACTN|nr:aminoglycoside phosphotransferase family protein [Actinoallomurus bryophytorum]TQL96139.1 aminoglycoside phosphotransferase (APT) family kinase protein [Actinoallomurus bryophytorum]
MPHLRPGEVAIDAGLVRRLVAAQFPQWAGLPVEPVGLSGLDNATYRLGEEMSVRLPRLPRWLGQVEREQRWLPWLAPRLPLPVPVPLARGVPGEGYPFDWSVYRWLDGENADLDGIADPRRAAAGLAEFFGALQSLDPAGGPPPEASNGFRGVPVDDERDSAVVATRMRARIGALEGLVDTGAVTAVWEAALAAPAWDGPPVWIHGDPAPANMLMRDGRLSAVIDFGTMAVGDPACDLIVAWAFLTAETRDVFRAALPVDDATWARGRAWGLTACLPTAADLSGGDPERAARVRSRLDDLVADHQTG